MRNVLVLNYELSGKHSEIKQYNSNNITSKTINVIL